MSEPVTTIARKSSQTQQSRAAESASVNAEPTPYNDPVAYLERKGWRPQGDPHGYTTRWLDPTKPLTPTQEKRVVLKRETTSGVSEQLEQMHITPAAWPMTLDEAIAQQVIYDAEKR